MPLLFVNQLSRHGLAIEQSRDPVELLLAKVAVGGELRDVVQGLLDLRGGRLAIGLGGDDAGLGLL